MSEEATERSLEAPDEDAAEQHAEIRDDERERHGEIPRSLPFDVNEADAAEQVREVELDEDDYR